MLTQFVRALPRVSFVLTLCGPLLLYSTLMVSTVASTANGQEANTTEAAAENVAAGNVDEMAEHFAAFSELLTGSTLVGHFTIPGMKSDKPMHEERYDIRSVKKSVRGDYWLFMARIKYGDHDVTVPMPLEVKWAGTTPVITLDAVAIPKLGTFDARVVIDGKQYAGTWRHGEVGGTMFGRIETKADKEEAKVKDGAKE